MFLVVTPGGVTMGLIAIIVGVLLIVNGVSAHATPGSVMHQIYSAIYIVGGAVVVTIGFAINALDDLRALTKTYVRPATAPSASIPSAPHHASPPPWKSGDPDENRYGGPL